MRKKLLFVVKYAVALAMVGWVLHQANLSGIAEVFAGISPAFALLAFVFFNLGQCASSERMRYYYRRAGFALERNFTLRLTYVSMFYNILVPGGVGGDAYRVALLRKLQDVPIGKGVRLQLSGRVSGLVAICLLMLSLLLVSSLKLPEELLVIGSAMCVLAGGFVYLFVLLPLLGEDKRTAAGALLWSLLAQILALVGVSALCAGLGAEEAHLPDYMLLYLAAALAGMLPITIGGLGVREFTFFYGAQWIGKLGGAGLHPELGVALALACFGITLASSLLGVLWMGSMRKTLQPAEEVAA